MIQRSKQREPQLRTRTQSLMPRNHLSYCDLDLWFDVEQPATCLEFAHHNASIISIATTYDCPLVRVEVEHNTRPLQRQAKAAIDATNFTIHVDQREVETRRRTNSVRRG